MYSGFKHLTPRAAASLTSTLTSPGFNRLKSTNRWEVSLNSEGEGSGNTYTGGERVNTIQSNQRRGKRKSLPVRSQKSNDNYGFSVESKEKRRQKTLAPPDCSSRLNPASLAWSIFSITVQPPNAPCMSTALGAAPCTCMLIQAKHKYVYLLIWAAL